MFKNGLYEQLINNLISKKLKSLDLETIYYKTTTIEKSEASTFLTQYISNFINHSLNLISGENSVETQINIINKIILLLQEEIEKQDFKENLLDINTSILKAVIPKLDSHIKDFDTYIKEITPYTGLTQSELFTGSNAGVSLESEIKKEILSSDKIYFLVSFIKWSGIRIFEKELREFTKRGKQLKVITTSYMGATDLKAVEFLASLPNTQIKVSYNIANENISVGVLSLLCINIASAPALE